MLSINTNISSLVAQNSLKNSTLKLNQAVERMSTGFKINGAKDNAANYSIATNMSTKIGAYQVAEDNAAMGLDLITTASESLNLISDKLARLRALAEQAANGTYGEQSKQAINAEANAIVDEIQRSYNNTEYNGIKLFGETGGSFISEVVQRDTGSMTTLASVDENTTLASGSYSISTAEEMAKLARMSKKKLIAEGSEFVLANNIDLSAYSTGEGWEPISNFKGNFDGNGYVISNLYMNSNRYRLGLFVSLEGEIKNVGLENINITTTNCDAIVGGLVCDDDYNGGKRCQINNCYVTGEINAQFKDYDKQSAQIGGMVGNGWWDTHISDCYTDINFNVELSTTNIYTPDPYATGNHIEFYIGGILGKMDHDSEVNNCYTNGKINFNYIENTTFDYNDIRLGCIVGQAYPRISNCWTNLDIINNCQDAMVQTNGYYDKDKLNFGPASYGLSTEELNQKIADGTLASNKYGIETLENNLNLQIGINSDDASQITLNTVFSISGLSSLRQIGLGTADYLATVDNLLNKVTAKQTEYGAAQNRLESALEEISTQYENLMSSRSTLKDADVAKESSEYIKQQILQQASATLLATANQTPALALQLL